MEHKSLFFLTPYIFHQFLTHNFYSKVKFKIHHFTFRFELSSGFPTFDFLERIFDFAKQSPRLRKRRGRSGIEQPSSGAHGIGTDSRELLVKYLPWAMLAPIRYISRTRDIISTQLLFLPFSSSCGECNRSNFNERPLGIQRPNQNFTSNFRNDVFEQVEINYRYRTNGTLEKVFYSSNVRMTLNIRFRCSQAKVFEVYKGRATLHERGVARWLEGSKPGTASSMVFNHPTAERRICCRSVENLCFSFLYSYFPFSFSSILYICTLWNFENRW